VKDNSKKSRVNNGPAFLLLPYTSLAYERSIVTEANFDQTSQENKAFQIM